MEITNALADVDLNALRSICGDSWQISQYREKLPTLGIGVKYRIQSLHARRAMYWHILLKGAEPQFSDTAEVDFLHQSAQGLLNLTTPPSRLTNTISTDLSEFTEKDKLSALMPDDVPETMPLDGFSLPKGEIWIAKPVGEGAASGSAVRCVYSVESLRSAREEIARNPSWRGIVSKYIRSPVLYRGKKFHLRGYIALRSWAEPVFLPFASAYLAATEYTDGSFGDTSMHITHYSDSFARVVFPEDFEGIAEYVKLWRELMTRLCKQLPKVQPVSSSQFGYEILAPDVLFQRDPPRAYLLEINRMTGRLIDTPGKSTWDQTIIMWEYSHCVEPILSRFSKRYYLFSGKPDPQQSHLESALRGAGLQPYPDCDYVKDGQLIPQDAKLYLMPFYLHITSLLSTGKTGYDHNTYTAMGKIQNVLDLATCPVSDKGWLHRQPQMAPWVANSFDLAEFQWSRGAYICRPVGTKYCAGYGIKYIDSAESEAAARKYYADLAKRERKGFSVIVSEYFSPMWLYPIGSENYKCHLRLYACISASTAFRENVKLSRFGKLFPAKSPFIPADYGNMDIHDTHAESHSGDLFYPEDFPRPDLLDTISQDMEKIESVLSALTSTLRVYPQFAYGYCIYGIDIMIMNYGHLRIIEINDRTGFECQQSNDEFYRKLADFELEYGIRAGL